jgi:hypothetical protein
MDDYLRIASEWQSLLSNYPSIDISSATIGNFEVQLPILMQFIHATPWAFVRKNQVKDGIQT